MYTLRPTIALAALLLYAVLIPGLSKACMCNNSTIIDSLPELAAYTFIAHVRITGDRDIPVNSKDVALPPNGELSFEILELFKGKKQGKILEAGKHSSCDIGISNGEEWVLFGINYKGNTVVVACDRNVRYRAADGVRSWQYSHSFYELDRLRTLYNHPSPVFTNETNRLFYKDGKLELEETYVNGKLHGEQKIWYPNGKLYRRAYYINDTLYGQVTHFYSSGQIERSDYYIEGRHAHVSSVYYDTSLYSAYVTDAVILKQRAIREKLRGKFIPKSSPQKIQVRYERMYDERGNLILKRNYSDEGVLLSEEMTEPKD